MTLAKSIIYGTKADVISWLSKGEDDINVLDEYGYTPLIEAAMFNKIDIGQLLIDRGAWINGSDIVGSNALHWSVYYSHYDFTKMLLEQGANPNAYNKSCQPVLTYPYLRSDEKFKDLFYQFGAKLDFVQDFINAKLVGHRYELEGQIHIVDYANQFILLDYEGFYLEFTLSIITDSLKRYKRNFAARHLTAYFKYIEAMVRALEIASYLIQFQHYEPIYKNHEQEIDQTLNFPLLVFPLAFEGHAITCVKYGNLWIKVDRGWNSRVEGSVVVYRITKPERVTKALMKHLIYTKQTRAYVNEELNNEIGLEKIGELPLPQQIIGNCSWANVEGSIAAMLFALLMNGDANQDYQHFLRQERFAIDFFEEWREWDKDRALEELVQSFQYADDVRKMAKAGLMAAVLVQKCLYTNERDILRAEKVFPILGMPEYQYLLKSYLKVYVDKGHTEKGDNLLHLFDLAAPPGMSIKLGSDEPRERHR